MKKCLSVTLLSSVMMTLLFSLSAGFAGAAESAPMTPEYAAKKENHRKQQEQRITNSQRKTAAEGLKAERMKVYKAKQSVKKEKLHDHDQQPVAPR
jgi:hypothetical protein